MRFDECRHAKGTEMTEERSGANLDEARAAIDYVDRKMAELFAQRMEAVADVAAYKAERGLPIRDRKREAQVLERNAVLVDEAVRPYYLRFMEAVMEESRRYQLQLLGKDA